MDKQPEGLTVIITKTELHEVIVTSFMRVVYPLKYPSNVCLSCLDNGACCWKANITGVLSVSGCLTKI